MLEKLVKKRRISKWMVWVISHLVLYIITWKTIPYLLSSYTLRHRLNRSSARSYVRVVQLHAANQFHHGSWTETDLPLFVGFPNSGNGFLSKCFHEQSEKDYSRSQIVSSPSKRTIHAFWNQFHSKRYSQGRLRIRFCHSKTQEALSHDEHEVGTVLSFIVHKRVDRW